MTETIERFWNFAERPRDADELFGADGHRRLRLVKSIYDPHDFIQAAQPVRPVEP